MVVPIQGWNTEEDLLIHLPTMSGGHFFHSGFAAYICEGAPGWVSLAVQKYQWILLQLDSKFRGDDVILW